MFRTNVDGIIISYSSFTSSAISTAKQALSRAVLALVDLKDIFDVLNQGKDLSEFFSNLIRDVKLYQNPKPSVTISELKNIDYSQYI